jgi:hypothetical protein
VTDRELIAKKLALIETYVRELQVLADPTRIDADVREGQSCGTCSRITWASSLHS